MSKFYHGARLALALTTSLAAVAAPAQLWAQEGGAGSAGAATEDNSGDIVVTATRRELRLQDVPLSISAVDGERLGQLGARDTQDYVLTTPGVSFVDASGGRQSFVIRGVSPLASGATTAIYLDETPLDIDLRLFDVARVEVLRGPQGTLYGQSSMGGAIRTITNKPDSTGFAAAVEASINSVHRGGIGGDVNLMVNVPIIADKLAIRGVFYHEREAGFIDNYEVADRIPGLVRDPSVNPVTPTNLIKKDRGAHDIDGARIAVQFDPVERVSITGTVIWQKDRYNGLNSEDTDIGYGRLLQSRAFDEVWGSETKQFNLTTRVDAGFAELMSSTTWNRGTQRTERDTTYVYGPLFALFYNSVIGDGRDPADLFGAPALYENYRTRQFTQELRLTSQGDGPLGWVVGGYYNNYRLTGLQSLVVPGLADAFGPAADLLFAGGDEALEFRPDQRAEELSGYAELTYKLTDRLGLTAGIRHYWVKSSFDDYTHSPAFGYDEDQTAGEATESGNTYKLGLDYKLTDNLLLYAVAASGYRAGGPNGSVPPGGTPVIPKSFESDDLWQYELGFRSHFLGNRIVINGAFYRIDWNDIQIAQNDDRGFSGVFNAGKARINGAELELQVKPSRSFSISSAVSFTDAKFAESFGAFAKGENIPNIPELTANLVARYETNVFGDWTGFLQGAASYVDNRYTYLGGGVGNRRRLVLEDYTKVDVRVGANKGPYEVALFVNNLFDARGQIGREDNLGYERMQYIPPRTVGLSLKAGF